LGAILNRAGALLGARILDAVIGVVVRAIFLYGAWLANARNFASITRAAITGATITWIPICICGPLFRVHTGTHFLIVLQAIDALVAVLDGTPTEKQAAHAR
jgi:hypothetical protein